jgi:hypothetical protein
MSKLHSRLRKEIKKYKKENNLNTSSLRGHKIHGVAHDTIRKIMTVEGYIPRKGTIKKLLKGFEIKFEDTYEGIKLVK